MLLPDDRVALQLAEIRRRDEMAAVAQWRLARQVEAAGRPAPRFHRHWLAEFGGLLAAWGCALQTRYQDVPALAGQPAGVRCR